MRASQKMRDRAALLLPPLLFIAALIGSVGVILPAALLMLATNGCLLPVYRWIADSTAFAWFTLSGALLEWLARVRVVVRGDGATRPADELVSIIICNHNSRRAGSPCCHILPHCSQRSSLAEPAELTGRAHCLTCHILYRLDWMFLWCLVARHRSCSRLKIALQKPLKAAGPFGWAMQVCNPAFLLCRALCHCAAAATHL